MTLTAPYTPYGAIDTLFAPLKAYADGDAAKMVRLGREWKETLIEGPAGTGKSRGVAQYIDTLCVLFPGIRVLACRQTMASLRDSVQVALESHVWGGEHPCTTGGAGRDHRVRYVYPQSTNVVGGQVYSGRSEIVLRGLDKPGRTFSTEFDIVWVEEAFEITLDSHESLLRTLRYKHMPWQQIILTTNPDGVFHWLNKRPEEINEKTGRPLMRRLLSRHWENPFLWDIDGNRWTDDGEEYVRETLENMSGVRRERLLKGLWFAAEGLIWDSYDPAIHVIPRDKIPKLKWAFGALDFGMRNPSAFTAWGVDKEDRIYCIFEFYKPESSLDWMAEQIGVINERMRAEFSVEMSCVVADNENPLAIKALNDLLRKPLYEGVTYIRPTKNKRQLAQLQLVDRAMRMDVPLNGGKPSWYIAEETLIHNPDPSRLQARKPHSLKTEIPGYVWRKAEDGKAVKDEEAPGSEAHACDTARYAADFVWGRDLSAPPTGRKNKPGSAGDVLGISPEDY